MQATTQAKKPATLKKLPVKNKTNAISVCFIMILHGFLGFLEKNKQNMDKFIV